MTVSAVVLTHNNEASIAAVLEGLKWCDERILIDDFSTDDTLTRARAYNVKIVQRHIRDNFAAQRNAGLTEARGDWVLFIDSDEIVTNSLQKEILKNIYTDHLSNAFYIKRKDFLFGRELTHGETAQAQFVRLAKRNSGLWSRRVHETWNIQNGPVATLSTPLLHYPHTNVAQFLNQINWYSTIHAEVLYAERKRISFWLILIYPAMKFIQNYFLRLGFLDGTAGLISAVMMSFHSFLARGKMWELGKKKKY
jgi:glycosyltransferase involved in cell wall biosynthesis